MCAHWQARAVTLQVAGCHTPKSKTKPHLQSGSDRDGGCGLRFRGNGRDSNLVCGLQWSIPTRQTGQGERAWACAWDALPYAWDALPYAWDALPYAWDALPYAWDALPYAWDALPHAVSRRCCRSAHHQLKSPAPPSPPNSTAVTCQVSRAETKTRDSDSVTCHRWH